MNPLSTSPVPSHATFQQKCGNEACKETYSTLLKCSRCHDKAYCRVECQKADWPQHRKVCVLKAKGLEAQMVEIKTPIPGLRLIENFISDDFHKRFIQEMHQGIPEMNIGHYDGYTFKDDEAFDKVFCPLIKDIFEKLKKLEYFSKEEKPFKLACSLIGYEKEGFIMRHIDSHADGGNTVVIISFIPKHLQKLDFELRQSLGI